jgi:hypothetical protein
MTKIDIDNDSLVETELVQVDCLYGSFEKITNGSEPTKMNIFKAISWINDRYKFNFIPKNDEILNFSAIENWTYVSTKEYDDFLKHFSTSEKAGRKALIRILNIQIMFLEKVCRERVEFVGHLSKIASILRPSTTDATIKVEPMIPTDLHILPLKLPTVDKNVTTLNLNNSHIKTDKLKSFDGNNSNYSWTDFVDQIDEIVRIDNIHESKILSIVAPLLEQYAKNEFRLLCIQSKDNSNNMNWQMLKRHFHNVFKDENDDRRIKEQLLNLTAKENDNFHQYLAEFNELKSKLGGKYSEQGMKNLFIRGLNRNLREKMLEKSPTSLIDTIERAQFLHSTHKSCLVGSKVNEVALAKPIPDNNFLTVNKFACNSSDGNIYNGNTVQEEININGNKQIMLEARGSLEIREEIIILRWRRTFKPICVKFDKLFQVDYLTEVREMAECKPRNWVVIFQKTNYKCKMAISVWHDLVQSAYKMHTAGFIKLMNSVNVYSKYDRQNHEYYKRKHYFEDNSDHKRVKNAPSFRSFQSSNSDCTLPSGIDAEQASLQEMQIFKRFFLYQQQQRLQEANSDSVQTTRLHIQPRTTEAVACNPNMRSPQNADTNKPKSENI